MTQKSRGTERVVLLDTFRCIVCLYIKVLLEFLWIMHPRLLIIAPTIRLHGEGVSKPLFFEGKYDTKMKFPEGWGDSK